MASQKILTPDLCIYCIPGRHLKLCQPVITCQTLFLKQGSERAWRWCLSFSVCCFTAPQSHSDMLFYCTVTWGMQCLNTKSYGCGYRRWTTQIRAFYKCPVFKRRCDTAANRWNGHQYSGFFFTISSPICFSTQLLLICSCSLFQLRKVYGFIWLIHEVSFRNDEVLICVNMWDVTGWWHKQRRPYSDVIPN